MDADHGALPAEAVYQVRRHREDVVLVASSSGPSEVLCLYDRMVRSLRGFVTCMQADVATNGWVQPVDEVRLEVSLLPDRRGSIRVLAGNPSSSAGNDAKSWLNHYVPDFKCL